MAEYLNLHDFVPMNRFLDEYPITIDLVYAQENHPNNHFDQLYHPEASILWLHKDMAKIVLAASIHMHEKYGWALELIDGLRPMEAQTVMASYGYPEGMVSPVAGMGGHPRAMAIDVHPLGPDGKHLDMGTPFDQFVMDMEKEINYADRSITDFGDGEARNKSIAENRERLEKAMLEAASTFAFPLIALSSEWWDFRFESSYTSQFKPLREDDLLPCQRLINLDKLAVNDVLSGKDTSFDAALKAVINDLKAA